MKKNFIFSILILLSIVSVSAVSCSPQNYSSGDLCMNLGRTSPTNLSTYITQISGVAGHWLDSSAVCVGQYYIDERTGFLKLQTTSLPFTGNYTFRFYYGIGSPGDIGNEDFTLKCGNKIYNFPDNDDTSTTNSFRYAEVICAFNSGYNNVEFQSTNIGSVHFKEFKITGQLTCPPTPFCGDQTCNNGETCSTCSTDCGVCPPTCGDGTCNGAETCSTCPGDCGVCPPTCGDGTCNGAETCSTCPGDCGVCPPPVEHNIAVRYSYSSSFGTGIAVGYENGTWISGNPTNLREGIYKIKYFIDNKEVADDNIHGIVKIDNTVLLDYFYLTNNYHSKEISINTSQFCGLHTLSVNVTSDGAETNLSDNYASRQIYVNCTITPPTPFCGDHTCNNGETCSTCPGDCGVCPPTPICGDGICSSSETCSTCSSDCGVCPPPFSCGNGILEIGEQCDRGILNGFLCWARYGSSCNYCSNTCQNKTITNYCGDSIKQECEECDDGNLVNTDGCSNLCKLNDSPPTGNHDIAVRYSYSSSFGTGIAVGYENETWINGNPANLNEGIYKIKYFIGNKEVEDDNIHGIVKIDNTVLLDYFYLTNNYHSKEISINTSQFCGLHTLSVNVTSDGPETNLSDNYASRQIYVNCTITPPTPFCGDQTCNNGETCSTCPGDCGVCPPTPICGDGICSSSETCSTCSSDCGSCDDDDDSCKSCKSNTLKFYDYTLTNDPVIIHSFAQPETASLSGNVIKSNQDNILNSKNTFLIILALIIILLIILLVIIISRMRK